MVEKSYRHCFESAARAAGRTLSEDDLFTLFSRAQNRMDRLVQDGMTPREAAMAAGQQLGEAQRLAAIVEERNSKLNLAVRHNLLSRIRDGEEFTSVEGILAGEKRGNARGASLSVNARVKAAEARHLGTLVARLRRSGLLKTARSARGELESDIARDLAHLNNPERFKPSGHDHALSIAREYHATMEDVRNEQNKAGAWIGKSELYVARQSHDMMKVRGRGPSGDFEAWREAIQPLLDEKTFDDLPEGMNRTEFLRATWQALASGVHESANGADWLSGFKGPSNFARRASQERVLHFKGPDEWMTYNRQFGRGSLHEAILQSVHSGARNAAVMRELGTNPEAMFDYIVDKAIDQAKRRNDMIQSDRLQPLKLHGLLDTITGKAAPVRNWTAKRVGGNIRALQSLTKLGGVVLSSLPDIAVRSASLRHNGVPLLESYWRTVSDLMPAPAQSGRRQVAHSMGIGVQGMLGDIATRFAMEDGLSGTMSKGVTWLHKLNGLTYWTDSLQAGAASMLANHLGRDAGKTFEALHTRTQNALRRYGIEANEWNVIRQAAQKAEDGEHYLMPGDIRALDANLFSRLKDTKSAEGIRDDVADRLGAYITDAVHDAMSEPDIRTTARIQSVYRALDGVSPWVAQALRMIAQFKTYPLSFLARSWNREVQRNGVDVPGIVHLMVGTTLLGYAAMSAKQVAAGKTPRDAGDFKTWIAAMQQGGGAGIYGDFLFGEQSRMGNSFEETLGGPAFSDLSNIYRLFANSRDEIEGATGAPSSRAYLTNFASTARGFIPGGNLFYMKLVIDHMFYNEMQEAMNPGYLARYQAGVLHSTGQTFWLNPAWSPYQALGHQ